MAVLSLLGRYISKDTNILLICRVEAEDKRFIVFLPQREVPETGREPSFREKSQRCEFGQLVASASKPHWELHPGVLIAVKERN